MKRRLLVVVGAGLITVSIFFMGFQSRNKLIETMGYEVRNSNYKEIINSVGTVEYEGELNIKAVISGTVLEVNTDIGERIYKEDLLVKIDNRQALIDYNDAVKKSLIAKARYNDYMNMYHQSVESIKDERLIQENEIKLLELEKNQLNSKILTTKELLSKGAVPPKDLEALNNQMDFIILKLETLNVRLKALRDPTLAVEEIQASMDATNESIHRQKVELTKYLIQSPVDGIVIEKNVELGTFIQQGEVLLKVTSDKEKYVAIEIDEKYIGKVSIGKEVQIFIEAYPKEVIKGRVVKINPEVNKETGTIGIKIKILEKQQLFLQNMAVSVSFVGETFDNTIVIEGEYLVNDGHPAVYIKDENGVAIRKEVKVYNKNTKMVRILEGLKVGDVVLNPKNLTEGVKVRVTLSQGSEDNL